MNSLYGFINDNLILKYFIAGALGMVLLCIAILSAWIMYRVITGKIFNQAISPVMSGELQAQIEALQQCKSLYQRPVIIRFDEETMRTFDELAKEYPTRKETLLGALIHMGLTASGKRVLG